MTSFITRFPHLFIAAVTFTAPFHVQAQTLQVATLHPVLNDVAVQVGGDKVEVTPVVAAGADMHHFSPTPGDIKKLAGTKIILVGGKGLENYLDKLRSNLNGGQTIVEVGRTIPSLKIDPANAMFMCCPEHAKGAIDPHWWNSPANMARAGRIIADAYSEADPANKDLYRTNASAWTNRMDALEKWAKKEISGMPSSQRKLATAHLAMSYFAKEFGFKLIPIQGLNHNTSVTPQELAGAIKSIRDNKVTAIFPEQGVNAKYLRQLTSETGIKLGGEIVVDGNGTKDLAAFEASFRHNVQTIVAALKQ